MANFGTLPFVNYAFLVQHGFVQINMPPKSLFIIFDLLQLPTPLLGKLRASNWAQCTLLWSRSNQVFLLQIPYVGGWGVGSPTISEQTEPALEPRQVMLPSTLLWRPCGGKATGIGSTNPEVETWEITKGAPQIIHFNGIFLYKPSVVGYFPGKSPRVVNPRVSIISTSSWRYIWTLQLGEQRSLGFATWQLGGNESMIMLEHGMGCIIMPLGRVSSIIFSVFFAYLAGGIRIRCHFFVLPILAAELLAWHLQALWSSTSLGLFGLVQGKNGRNNLEQPRFHGKNRGFP